MRWTILPAISTLLALSMEGCAAPSNCSDAECEADSVVGDTTDGASEGTTSEGTTSEGTTSEDTTSEDTTSEDTTTGDTTSDDTTSDDTTTDDTTTEDTDDPPGPMAGDPCDLGFTFACMGGPTPEDAGIPLLCSDDTLLFEPTELFDDACAGLCIDQTAMPVNACGGIWDPWCLCLSPDAPDCEGAQLGCVQGELWLCHAGKVVVAACPGCMATPEGWFDCQ